MIEPTKYHFWEQKLILQSFKNGSTDDNSYYRLVLHKRHQYLPDGHLIEYIWFRFKDIV